MSRVSDGLCAALIRDVCQGGRAAHSHHRKRRREGDERPVNRLAMCKPCHDYAHAHPAWARGWGLIVRSTSDPAAIAAVTYAVPGQDGPYTEEI